MNARLNQHPVRVAVGGDRSERGFLVFAEGVLVAVISHLEETVDNELRDSWFLEAGFGPCGGVIPPPIWNSQEEAERWVSNRMRGRSFPER